MRHFCEFVLIKTGSVTVIPVDSIVRINSSKDHADGSWIVTCDNERNLVQGTPEEIRDRLMECQRQPMKVV